jgi:hypothetical protein
LGTPRHFNVRPQRIVGIAELPLRHGASGKRFKCRRPDELVRRFGHHHRHPGAGLHQLTHQRRRFIGCDAAGHADQDLSALHILLAPRRRGDTEQQNI